MPANTSRWGLLSKMADLYAAHRLAGELTVLAFPPGELDVTDDMLFFSSLSSDVGEGPGQTAGRYFRDDLLLIEWAVGVNGLSDPEACMTRLDEIVTVVDDVHANNRSLDGTVDDSWFTGIGDLQPIRSPDGFYLLGKLKTTVQIRLT